VTPHRKQFLIGLALAVGVSLFGCAGSQAKPLLHHKAHAHRFVPDASGNEVVDGRPEGCPHAFCGCEASLFLFGRIFPDLNLAANWLRKFPRAKPGPHMVAARNHHVMVLLRHIKGKLWFVHDGNSGGHKTREHVRSIAGFKIVDPSPRLANSGQYAMTE
jgi:hypothetical protein